MDLAWASSALSLSEYVWKALAFTPSLHVASRESLVGHYVKWDAGIQESSLTSQG